MDYDLEFEKEFIKYQEKEQQEEVKKFKEKTSNYYILGYIYKLEQENERLKEQQHEFIDYLEKESKEVIRDAGYHKSICLDILENYKKIIGRGK